MTVKEPDKKPAFHPRRDTAAISKQVDYVLEMILSKDLGEVLIAAEKEIDPTKMHHMYTQRLLDLQACLNERQSKLGSETATNINRHLEALGYITALSLIDYILESSVHQDHSTIVALPEVVADIRGKNGTDSRMLRYNFVERVLPSTGRRDLPALERLARAYMRKYDKPNMQEVESHDSAHIWRRVCISDYGGDFEAMKRQALATMRSTLEPIIRKINAIDGAEMAGSATSSDYKDT